jgi:hypothetical protein
MYPIIASKSLRKSDVIKIGAFIKILSLPIVFVIFGRKDGFTPAVVNI